MPRVAWALAIHAGAGVIPKDMEEERKQEYFQALEDALSLGRDLLATGTPSLDVVEQVVRQLEDVPLFNAGKGAVFTSEGTNELDAAIMDGSTMACGAVSGVKTVKNPVLLARKVMEETRHILLVGRGAETFAASQGLEMVEPAYFFTQRRYDQWRERVEQEAADSGAGKAEPKFKCVDPAGEDKRGTVGAVALDQFGNLAAATSTGGLTNKRFGRVGDTPIVGAGTYANNRTCAVSGTGIGEQFMRHAVAHDISARMEHGGLGLQEAAEAVIHGVLAAGDGGVIAVGRDGQIALVFNSAGMFRGAADSSGRFDIAIWE